MEMNLVKLLVDPQRRRSDARVQRSAQRKIKLAAELENVLPAVDRALEVDGHQEGAEVAPVG